MPKDCQDCTSCTPPKKRFWLVIHLRWCALVAVASMAVWTVGWAQDNPALLGQWSAPQNWPARAIHAHLLPTGKVLFWDDIEPVGTHLWDPATNTFSVVSGPGYIHYCTGHSLLASGQLFIAGGHVAISVGLPNASIFDPVTGLWTRLPNMNDRRWYPTVTTLPSGDVVVVSGHITAATNNNILPQVWQTATGTWRDLTGAQRRLALYPWLFVAPNGKVFHAGSGQASLFLDTSGTGSWTFVANTSALNRESGTAVMYGQGKVIVIGGADPPLATAEVIDLNSPSPAWRDIASMSAARRQPNATLLPDGTVLVTGGSSGEGFDNETAPVLAAELWNPATETWTSLASSTIYRGYHSVAFLLPDGRRNRQLLWQRGDLLAAVPLPGAAANH